MLSLKERLRLAEDECLSALVEGGDALSGFLSRWERLSEDLDHAQSTATLDSDTSLLAHSVAVRVAELADISADLFSNYDTITGELVQELDGIMSELTISPVHTLPASSPSGDRATPRKRHRCSSDDVSTLSGKHIKRRRVCSDDEGSPSLSVGCRPVKPLPHTLASVTQARSSLGHLKTLPTSLPLATPVIGTPKRCLSESDTTIPIRPSKRMCISPRLHAVSDSYKLFRMDEPSGSKMPPSCIARSSSSIANVDPLAHDGIASDTEDHTLYPSPTDTAHLLSELDDLLGTLLSPATSVARSATPESLLDLSPSPFSPSSCPQTPPSSYHPDGLLCDLGSTNLFLHNPFDNLSPYTAFEDFELPSTLPVPNLADAPASNKVSPSVFAESFAGHFERPCVFPLDDVDWLSFPSPSSPRYYACEHLPSLAISEPISLIPEALLQCPLHFDKPSRVTSVAIGHTSIM